MTHISSPWIFGGMFTIYLRNNSLVKNNTIALFLIFKGKCCDTVRNI